MAFFFSFEKGLNILLLIPYLVHNCDTNAKFESLKYTLENLKTKS